MNQTARIPVLVNGQVVAYFIGSTLYKSIDGKRHMLKKPPAITFDKQVIDTAVRQGMQLVEVYDRDTRHTYRCTMDDFRSYSFEFNRGFGPQLALPLTHWGVNGQPSPHQQRIEREKEKERTSQSQLALFDV